ncbi:MAG: hypothetical protein MHPSP_004372, partial [Paramarteilia canceri]
TVKFGADYGAEILQKLYKKNFDKCSDIFEKERKKVQDKNAFEKAIMMFDLNFKFEPIEDITNKEGQENLFCLAIMAMFCSSLKSSYNSNSSQNREFENSFFYIRKITAEIIRRLSKDQNKEIDIALKIEDVNAYEPLKENEKKSYLINLINSWNKMQKKDAYKLNLKGNEDMDIDSEEIIKSVTEFANDKIRFFEKERKIFIA